MLRGFEGEGSGSRNPERPYDDPQQTVYAVADVELGDLEDDEGDNCSFIRIDDEYHFPTIADRDEVVPSGAQNANEVEGLGYLSDNDDLASTFTKALLLQAGHRMKTIYTGLISEY